MAGQRPTARRRSMVKVAASALALVAGCACAFQSPSPAAWKAAIRVAAGARKLPQGGPLSLPVVLESTTRLYGVDDGSWLDKKGPRKGKKTKEELEMERQERKAVKKYLEQEQRKAEESRRRALEGQARNPATKKDDKDAPWKAGKPEAAAPPKKKASFKQISMTAREFSIDDIQSMTFEGSHLEDVPYLGLPEVAVFGRSNVGKSSLLNCLAGVNKAVAIVSKTPGRTQAINLFKVSDSNGPVTVIVDLPGYGYAKLPKALQSDIGMQVRRYLADRPTLRLAVLLLDSRREPQRSDLNMIRYFRAADVPLLVLATKVDKLKPEEVDANLDRLQSYFQLPDGQPVPFSSVTSLNKRTVWLAIRDACVGNFDSRT